MNSFHIARHRAFAYTSEQVQKRHTARKKAALRTLRHSQKRWKSRVRHRASITFWRLPPVRSGLGGRNCSRSMICRVTRRSARLHKARQTR